MIRTNVFVVALLVCQLGCDGNSNNSSGAVKGSVTNVNSTEDLTVAGVPEGGETTTNNGNPNSPETPQNPANLPPGQLVDTSIPTTLQPPANCVEICMEANDCTVNPLDTLCQNDCQLNACVPLTVPADSNAIKQFVIPAGYVAKEITVTACIDRADVLNIGWGMWFKHLAAGRVPSISNAAGSRWSQSGADVGRGNKCPNELNYTALIDYDGKQYKWAQPAYTHFPVMELIGLDKVEAGSAVYVTFSQFFGPGAIIPRIYNNHPNEDPLHPKAKGVQLDFAVEFFFWIDPVYQVVFKLYYLPRSTPS